MALSSNVTAPSLVEWRQSCLSYVPCLDCWVVWRAVVTKEIDHNQLKAGKKAFSHHRSKRRIVTARVEKRAVAADEIDHNRLKAGIDGNQSS